MSIGSGNESSGSSTRAAARLLRRVANELPDTRSRNLLTLLFDAPACCYCSRGALGHG